jgi:cytidylate kinase
MSDGAVARVVAIDGPSGSGKSTIGRGVATALGLDTLDTGAMYRAVTLAVLRAGADPTDGNAAAAVARDAKLGGNDGVTTLDGDDVSAEIRGPEVTGMVSTVSAHPAVRTELVARQRAWVAEHGGGVVEGRDIGSVVFPDAAVKVFLTASDEERARRRQQDEAKADRAVSMDEVRASMAARDAADSGRAASPLRTADGATIVDTTGRSVADIVAEIVGAFRVAEGAG